MDCENWTSRLLSAIEQAVRRIREAAADLIHPNSLGLGAIPAIHLEMQSESKEDWVPTRFHVGPFVGPSFWPVLKNMLLSAPEHSP